MQTPQQVIFVQRNAKRRRKQITGGKIQSVILHTDSCSTANCRHNHYIGVLEALWDMKRSEMYLLTTYIIHFASQDGYTTNEKDARTQTALVWA
jgi:hypothetical protein